MYKKLLLDKKPWWKWLIDILSTTVGMLIILFAIQLIIDFTRNSSDSKAVIDSQYYIITKPVTSINTVLNKSANFNQNELQEIENSGFIENLAPFLTSNFPVNAFMDDHSVFPGFYTELFFEALPDEYIDIDDRELWKWVEGENKIPLMLPKSYLNLYNFGFAPGQGLPQMSEEIARNFPFKIGIGTGKNKQVLNGKIVGFSERLNTILVPLSFLEWANEKYGSGKKTTITRIIVKAKNSESRQWISYLDDKNFYYEKSSGEFGKLTALLYSVFILLLVFGIIIVTLSISLQRNSNLLTIERHKVTIFKLNIIGFSQKQLTIPYLKRMILHFLFVFLFILTLFPLFYSNYYKIIESFLSHPPAPWFFCLISALLLLVILGYILFVSINRAINSILNN